MIIFIGLVSLFNGISTFMGYLQLFYFTISEEKQQWYFLTHSWKDKGFHNIPKGIRPKVNIIAQLEFELAYYDVTMQHISYYKIETTPHFTAEISHQLL